jgi:hypothetical protein
MSKSTTLLNADYVRSRLSYEFGKLFWIPRPLSHFSEARYCKTWNTRYAGTEAGTIRDKIKGDFRCYIGIDHISDILRSRLVWLIHNGTWPDLLDHKNRNPLDDRIENLRIATSMQNGANSGVRKHSKSGVKGVHLHRQSMKWIAQIRENGKGTYLGIFDDINDARNAYNKAAIRIHGDFACQG